MRIYYQPLTGARSSSGAAAKGDADLPKHKYLFPPAGYVIAELINVTDTERMRSLAKEMIAPDDPKTAEFNQVMDEASNAKLRQFFKTNGWIEKSKPALKKAGVYDIAKKGVPTNDNAPQRLARP